VVLCDRFGSGLLSHIYKREIRTACRWRAAIRALPDRRYDEANWWRSKPGIKSFFGAVFDQVYVRIRGEEPGRHVDFDPEAYEDRGLAGVR
jgi:hypothetical protein